MSASDQVMACYLIGSSHNLIQCLLIYNPHRYILGYLEFLMLLFLLPNLIFKNVIGNDIFFKWQLRFSCGNELNIILYFIDRWLDLLGWMILHCHFSEILHFFKFYITRNKAINAIFSGAQLGTTFISVSKFHLIWPLPIIWWIEWIFICNKYFECGCEYC